MDEQAGAIFLGRDLVRLCGYDFYPAPAYRNDDRSLDIHAVGDFKG